MGGQDTAAQKVNWDDKKLWTVILQWSICVLFICKGSLFLFVATTVLIAGFDSKHMHSQQNSNWKTKIIHLYEEWSAATRSGSGLASHVIIVCHKNSIGSRMALRRLEAEMSKVSSVLHKPLLMVFQYIEKLKFHILLLYFSNFSFRRKNVLCFVLFIVPSGVIQNGARVLSRGIFPGARPLPINPIGSMAVAVR